MLLWPDYNNLC